MDKILALIKAFFNKISVSLNFNNKYKNRISKNKRTSIKDNKFKNATVTKNEDSTIENNEFE